MKRNTDHTHSKPIEETGYTPGPWRVADEQIQCEKPNQYGNFIVVTCQRELTVEDVANLHLIAAAPELLEACRQALNPSEYSNFWPNLRAAIAKATGRPTKEGK